MYHLQQPLSKYTLHIINANKIFQESNLASMHSKHYARPFQLSKLAVVITLMMLFSGRVRADFIRVLLTVSRSPDRQVQVAMESGVTTLQEHMSIKEAVEMIESIRAKGRIVAAVHCKERITASNLLPIMQCLADEQASLEDF